MRASSALLSVCAALVLVPPLALAKRGTIGIYAIVDQVELEPGEESPERIRIRGVFVVPVPMSSGDYQPPQRGHLYFSLPPGAPETVQAEWHRIRAFSTTGRAIGFAQYWEADPADPQPVFEALRVRVYRDDEEAVPAPYPRSNTRGIAETADDADPDFDAIVARLRDAVID